MERKIKIVIPSKGRAQSIITHRYIDNCIACVAKSELAAYKEHNPDLEFVTHEDSLVGLGPKKQWIYQKFGDVFMVDDDIKGMIRMTVKAKQSGAVPSRLAYELIQNAGNMAALMGCYLFGFNKDIVPKTYKGHEPFKLTGYINGCGMGFLKGSKLRFNPDLKTNHDYYICALNAYHHRKCFIDKRFAFNQASFANAPGGSSGVRTNEVEKRDYELLVHYFGSAIKRQNHWEFSPKHEYQKTLHIPY